MYIHTRIHIFYVYVYILDSTGPFQFPDGVLKVTCSNFLVDFFLSTEDEYVRPQVILVVLYECSSTILSPIC